MKKLMLHGFNNLTLDYRVRGFTRDLRGKKHFIDHMIIPVQNFISRDTRDRYEMIDVNVCREHIFHTRMIIRESGFNS